MKEAIQKIKEKNDDYLNTIYAIIGFMNIYKFELGKKNIKVDLFQGRKFDKVKKEDNIEDSFVTPDIAILINDKSGVIGEVKNSFPKDDAFWDKDFKQLLNYDDDLIGWPVKDEKISSHDIVLLVEQARMVKVKDYYLSKCNTEIIFQKPFVIIEYNRLNQVKEFFYFRIGYGKLSEQIIHEKLYEGIPLSMSFFVSLYSKIRIYDSLPDLSWTLFLIYSCVLDKITAEDKFHKLNKKTKININTSVTEITQLLIETYSFHSIHKKHQERQPQFPKKDWIKEGVKKLVALEEAYWINDEQEQFTFIFKSHTDAKDYYENCCIAEHQSSSQTALDF